MKKIAFILGIGAMVMFTGCGYKMISRCDHFENGVCVNPESKHLYKKCNQPLKLKDGVYCRQ